MEHVLDVYKRPYDPRKPVVCMDESPKQLIEEIKTPIPHCPGASAKEDYEYRRNGTCCVFMANEPLAGNRHVEVKTSRTKEDWAAFVESISESHREAEKITLVMDNLNTHTLGALYETFEPAKAKSLSDRFEFVYTPKHGSWLNMAEIELNVLNSQCLSRRIPDIETVKSEVNAWESSRNNRGSKINWQFSVEKARVKLKRLYPTLQT